MRHRFDAGGKPVGRRSRAARAVHGAVGPLVSAIWLLTCGPAPRDAGPARAAPPETPKAVSAAPDLSGEARYSQGKEELIVRHFFNDRRDGTFLDVGCASPIVYNNTYYLEKHLGWSGIGVDGLPEFATPWKRKRPRSRFFNYLVSDHSDTVEPFFRAELRGTSSADKQGMQAPDGKPMRFDELRVPTITLTKLLDQAGVSRIDFVSMDIEGYEPVALDGFDVERFQPALACIEAKPKTREKLLAYFGAHGYERILDYVPYDETNWYFAPKSRPKTAR